MSATGGDGSNVARPLFHVPAPDEVAASAPKQRSNFFVLGRLGKPPSAPSPTGAASAAVYAHSVASIAPAPAHAGVEQRVEKEPAPPSTRPIPQSAPYAQPQPQAGPVPRVSQNPYKRAVSAPVASTATPATGVRDTARSQLTDVGAGAMPTLTYSPVARAAGSAPHVGGSGGGGSSDPVGTENGGFVVDDDFGSRKGRKEASSGTFAGDFAFLKQSSLYVEPPPPAPRPADAETVTGPLNDNAATKTFSSNSIIVNNRQRGNPVLKAIRNVPWEYGDIIPDFLLGGTTCALYLSLRYHNLHPEYVHQRIRELGRQYRLRVLLVQVDVKDSQFALKELSRLSVLTGQTMILSWSLEESGRYLETYKAYEKKPADMLQERVDTDYLSKMTDCLTSIKSINKTDVVTLLTGFGSLKNIIDASADDLSLCPGFGDQKIRRLQDTLNEPFFNRKRPRLQGGQGGAASQEAEVERALQETGGLASESAPARAENTESMETDVP